MTDVAVTGVYGWKAVWLTAGRGGIPIGWGGCAGLDLAPVFASPPAYCVGGFGEVAEETDEESYDLVDGFGDRGYGLCDDAAMAVGCLKCQNSAALFGTASTSSPIGWTLGSCRSKNMQVGVLTSLGKIQSYKEFGKFPTKSGPRHGLANSNVGAAFLPINAVQAKGVFFFGLLSRTRWPGLP
jgi:hypothetical protein